MQREVSGDEDWWRKKRTGKRVKGIGKELMLPCSSSTILYSKLLILLVGKRFTPHSIGFGRVLRSRWKSDSLNASPDFELPISSILYPSFSFPSTTPLDAFKTCILHYFIRIINKKILGYFHTLQLTNLPSYDNYLPLIFRARV